MKDYYKILEIEKTATDVEIKKSFRRLSKLHHPDREGGNHETFTDINEAYQVLSDPEKRKAYDTGKTPITLTKPVVNNINIRIKWTLKDIEKGKTMKVSFRKATICTTCNGVGSKKASAVTKCPHCNGSGIEIK